ncbi:thiol-disulfide oxidoreductase DCC family protein [Litorivivens sp.]|uniref:thiol-disulfide oxidoreductase DCC family protein n=1 Tax=Litorivivens sp. TaxID=2020868 RepID=UPI00356789A2
MSQPVECAPGIGQRDRVILFDGVCKLCSAWARFLIRFDKHRRFRLATVQSPEGQAILKWYGLSLDQYETLLLIEGPELYTQSIALIRVLWQLPLPWPLLAIGWLVPRPLRNWLYRRIAVNRYRIFGKYERCILPEENHRQRFLGND